MDTEKTLDKESESALREARKIKDDKKAVRAYDAEDALRMLKDDLDDYDSKALIEEMRLW